MARGDLDLDLRIIQWIPQTRAAWIDVQRHNKVGLLNVVLLSGQNNSERDHNDNDNDNDSSNSNRNAPLAPR